MPAVHKERLAATLVATCLAAVLQTAHAVGIQVGDLNGSWDTTLAYGQSWRVANPDCRLIATADGGCGRSPNIDDGDLNYLGKAVFSKSLSAVTELSLSYKSFGVFARASALHDFAVTNGDTDRTPLSPEARNLVGSYTRMLDAFGYWRFNLGKLPSELRLGKQVVSWGESTFIQGGLNTVNHFDVSALRTPGSELKQALLPDQMALFNVQFSEHLSGQFLYLLKWHQTQPEPDGSYFSTNDAATPAGRRVVLNFGEFSDLGVDYRPLGGPFISNFQQFGRTADRQPPDSGQYGLNFKFYLPNFSGGTEFGLYFLNYHSRLPVVSFRTGTQAGVGNAFGALTAVGGAAQALAAGLPYAAAVLTGAQAGAAAAARVGGNLSVAAAQQYATVGANTLLAGGNVTAQATNIATSEYAQTAGYFDEYPQNIKMLGVSFNTQLQKTGIALQGELTYRHGVPLQLDDVELVYAADPIRSWNCAAAQHSVAGDLPAGGGGFADPVQSDRRVRRKPGNPRLGLVRHLPGTVHRHQERSEHSEGLPARTALRERGGLDSRSAGQALRRSERAGVAPGWAGNQRQRQSAPGGIPTRRRGARQPVSDARLVGIRSCRPAGVSKPDRRVEHPAALLVGA